MDLVISIFGTTLTFCFQNSELHVLWHVMSETCLVLDATNVDFSGSPKAFLKGFSGSPKFIIGVTLAKILSLFQLVTKMCMDKNLEIA